MNNVSRSGGSLDDVEPFVTEVISPEQREEKLLQSLKEKTEEVEQLRTEVNDLRCSLERERALKQVTIIAIMKQLDSMKEMLSLVQIGGIKNGN